MVANHGDRGEGVHCSEQDHVHDLEERAAGIGLGEGLVHGFYVGGGGGYSQFDVVELCAWGRGGEGCGWRHGEGFCCGRSCGLDFVRMVVGRGVEVFYVL